MTVPTLAIVIGICVDGLLISKCRRDIRRALNQSIRRNEITRR